MMVDSKPGFGSSETSFGWRGGGTIGGGKQDLACAAVGVATLLALAFSL